MPTIPPSRPPDHPDTDETQLEALRVTYPAWHITRAAFLGHRAEWKSASGPSVRFVAGESIADLHHRLEIIEAARGESE
jgi:hypothetical protein